MTSADLWYALSKKHITLIGIFFSSARRTIVEERVEELPQVAAV